MTNFKFPCLTPYLWSTKIHEEPLVPLLGDMMNPSLAHPAVLSWCIPRLWPTFNRINIVLVMMINEDDQSCCPWWSMKLNQFYWSWWSIKMTNSHNSANLVSHDVNSCEASRWIRFALSIGHSKLSWWWCWWCCWCCYLNIELRTHYQWHSCAVWCTYPPPSPGPLLHHSECKIMFLGSYEWPLSQRLRCHIMHNKTLYLTSRTIDGVEVKGWHKESKIPVALGLDWFRLNLDWFRLNAVVLRMIYYMLFCR